MAISRRDFLKISAATVAAASLAPGTDAKVLQALTPQTAPMPAGETQIFHTVCPGAGDHQRCGVKVHVRDGRMVKVEADDFADPRYHKNACLRPLASMRWVYSPDRLKYPMKRVGNRGEGKWQRITWDEALDTIASKLTEIKNKYGEKAVHIRGSSSSTNGQLMRALPQRFSALWGPSVTKARGVIDANLPVATALVTGTVYGSVAHSPLDWRNSKLIVIWGENPAETDMRDMTHLLDARDAGAKLVLISPFFDPTAAKVDEFIPVFPATDAALALSLANVIIERGLYDEDFVSKFTNLPLLVRQDNKKFLRESDVTSGGDAKKYMLWDSKTNAAVAIGVGVNEIKGVTPTLLGSFTIGNFACKTAFQLLKERAAQYPPEKAATLTKVRTEQIKSFAAEYATTKPVYTKISHGSARTYQGPGIVRSQFYIAALTGNIGIPGGGIGYEGKDYEANLNTSAVSAPLEKSRAVTYTDTYSQYWTNVATGKGPYPIKAAILSNAAWVNYCGNSREWIEKIFPQLEFIAVCDPFMTATAQYADIVLPGQTQYERLDIDTALGTIRLCEKAIEPLYESRDNYELWTELGKRLGFGDYFKNTPEEYISMMLNSKDPTVAGITPPLTLERLKQAKYVRPNVPTTPYIAFRERKFPTPSGRMELYDERLIPFGEELPDFKEGYESPRTSPLASKYPLVFYTKKTRFNTQSQFRNVDWLLEISPEPILEINPADAAERGIKDGDVVKVFNDRGSCKVKTKFHDGMPPGVVNIPHGWFPNQFIQGFASDLCAPVTPPEKVDNPMSLVATAIDSAAGPGELLYDCLVEVAKA